ncbi:Putative lumazine-binding [Olivibacter domesticus]|uniref:Putative lumazine-binding n=2 Tax=Olivibacter domesticus TaxID=407022 RepID=A0A1H7UVR0_OLID1|nr:Putative lumazine-binding [Olivibacter domesticus]
MKIMIKITLAVMIVIAVSTSSTNASMKDSIKQTATDVLGRYIETVVYGIVENIGELFSDQFRQRTTANGKVITHTKSQLINFIKKHQHIEQDCITSSAVLEQNDGCSIAKVEMKYLEFTRIDYLMLSPEGKKWKVNQIVTTFRDNKTDVSEQP